MKPNPDINLVEEFVLYDRKLLNDKGETVATVTKPNPLSASEQHFDTIYLNLLEGKYQS